MISIEEAKQRIAVANSESQKLNSIRQQNIGRREALQKQFETNLRAYNEKFGTSITANDLVTEQERVISEKLKEVEKVEGVINAINTGDYALANKLSGVEVENSTPAVEPSQPEPTSVVQPTVEPVQVMEPTPVQVTPSPVQVAPSPSPVGVSPVQVSPSPVNVAPTPQPVEPTPQPVVATPQPVVATPQPVASTPSQAKPNLASLFGDDDDEQPAQPSNNTLNGALAGFQSLGGTPTPQPTPSKPAQPQTSFSSLLNNNQFADL